MVLQASKKYSLNSAFIRVIEEAESFDEVIVIIEKGLQNMFRLIFFSNAHCTAFERNCKGYNDDIIKLTEIKIKNLEIQQLRNR